MDGLKIFVNDRWIEPKTPYGAPALDFIRGELGLTGTKEGCREGDCGACAVLVGETAGGAGPRFAAKYRAVPSCLLALGELDGKHLITIEGLAAGATANAAASGAATSAASDGLTPVMRAFLEENASQCGFCSPGFVIALTSWLATPGKPDLAGAMTAVDGNLCRCTGYGAIRRAAERLAAEFADLPQEEAARLAALVERGVLPASALQYAAEAGRCPKGSRPLEPRAAAPRPETVLGGGTDFYVRTPDPAGDFQPLLLRSTQGFSDIETVERDSQSWLRTGAAATVSDFFASPLVRRAVPGIEAFEGDFASTLIRNMATLGGNIANASPVGDLTSMLIGLGAVLEVGDLAPASPAASGARYVPIEDFFLGYKKIDLREGEVIRAILMEAERPEAPLLFSFEKIAKRKKLDIAAVNTALSFRIEGGFARGVRLSAGGVAAVPALLKSASAALEGARVDRSDPVALARLARKVADAAEAEVRPIGDVRGSAEYRGRMTGRLVLAHFVRLFGADGIAKELFP